VIDERGLIRHVNPAAAAMFASPAEELLGQPVETLLDQPARGAFALLAQQARGSTIGPEPRQLAACRASGEKFAAGLWITPLPIRRQNWLSLTFQDIGSWLELQHALAETELARQHQADCLTALLRATSPRGILLLAGDGRIEQANPGAARCLGRAPQDLIGLTLAELSDPTELAALAAQLQATPGIDPVVVASQSFGPGPLAWVLLGARGQAIPVHLRVLAIGAGPRPDGYVCVLDTAESAWPEPSGTDPADRLLSELGLSVAPGLRWQVGGL
jgi:PAS domain S-box-containing protein